MLYAYHTTCLFKIPTTINVLSERFLPEFPSWLKKSTQKEYIIMHLKNQIKIQSLLKTIKKVKKLWYFNHFDVVL